MPAYASITPDKLARLVGTPKAPTILDVRPDKDVTTEPFLIPTAKRMPTETVAEWGKGYVGWPVVVICTRGKKISGGVAAWLRHYGVAAEILEGGIEAWKATGLPLVPVAALPRGNEDGNTVWVTRSRPKIGRIACPWLIRRFVDPRAVFLFVTAAEVEAVAERFSAAPFDIEGVFWSHRGERCTFDTMIEEFGLSTPALERLATIVRAADTARLDHAPEAAGPLAASLGLSRQHADDLEQLEAGIPLYDAFYRWARDATDETHNWPPQAKGARP